jgi:hypothetical protein
MKKYLIFTELNLVPLCFTISLSQGNEDVYEYPLSNSEFEHGVLPTFPFLNIQNVPETCVVIFGGFYGQNKNK